MRIGSSKGHTNTLEEAREMVRKGEIEGEIRDDCVVVNGNHPPMVSEDMFYRVQEILKERGLAHHCATPRIKDFLFAGMIHCGKCGCAVVTEEKTKYKCTQCKKWFTCSTSKPTPTHCKYCDEKLSKYTLENSFYYCYAHCSGKNKEKKICPQTYYSTGRGKPSVAVSDLMEQVDEMLSRLTMDEKVYDYCIETLKDEHFQNSLLENKALTALQKDHQLIKNKLDNLLEMRLNGEVDAELFAKKKDELNKKQTEIMNKLDKFNQKNKNWVEQTETFLNIASKAQYAFENESKETKREILKSIGSHIHLEGGKLRFELRKPFDVLLIPRFDENTKKAQKPASAPQFHEWLPRLDSN